MNATALTPDERAVLDVLVQHRGRAQAVGLEIVAGIAGVSERLVQEIVVQLIEHHGHPIGSAVKKPIGYFLIETASMPYSPEPTPPKTTSPRA